MQAHVADPLSEELDALFQAAPSAMVEARNALADRLRKAGDKAGAARIKAIKRPAPAAWALNQVHFHAPALLARAEAATAEVRALHARDAVDPRALMAAHEAQRAASKAVVDAAIEHCTRANVPSSAAHQRRLLGTLQAWLTGAGQTPPGRMTEELEPGGFDAIASVGSPAPRPPTRGGAASSATVPPARDDQAELAARARISTLERQLSEAEAIAHKRRFAHKRSEAERDRARAEAEEKARELAQLHALVAAKEAEFQAASASVAEAERALREVRAQLAAAQGALPQR
jgi:hypothetical protein